jgi:hypothetical protein
MQMVKCLEKLRFKVVAIAGHTETNFISRQQISMRLAVSIANAKLYCL